MHNRSDNGFDQSEDEKCRLFLVQESVEEKCYYTAEKTASHMEYEPAYPGDVKKLHEKAHKEKPDSQRGSIAPEYTGIRHCDCQCSFFPACQPVTDTGKGKGVACTHRITDEIDIIPDNRLSYADRREGCIEG